MRNSSRSLPAVNTPDPPVWMMQLDIGIVLGGVDRIAHPAIHVLRDRVLLSGRRPARSPASRPSSVTIQVIGHFQWSAEPCGGAATNPRMTAYMIRPRVQAREHRFSTATERCRGAIWIRSLTMRPGQCRLAEPVAMSPTTSWRAGSVVRGACGGGRIPGFLPRRPTTQLQRRSRFGLLGHFKVRSCGRARP